MSRQAIEWIDAAQPVDLRTIFGTKGGRYAMRVSGDGLLSEHVRDGDYAIIDSRAKPRKGDCVALRHADGRGFVGKLDRDRNTIRLTVAGQDAPKYFLKTRVRILGVVVGLARLPLPIGGLQ